MEPLAAQPAFFEVVRYSDGQVLAEDKGWRAWQEKAFGSGTWDLHRADLQMAMFRKAQQIGVEFKFGAIVDTIDCENAKIILQVISLMVFIVS